MDKGCNGQILRVDLSDGSLNNEFPDEYIYRKYMGGSALALYYLLKELKPRVDPLGPENKLVIMSSVIQGVATPGVVRFTVAAKSPLTDAFGEGEAGGFWGPELKFAGFDGIIIEGQSPEPVYLLIIDGKAEIKSASHLWGKDTGVVQAIIREENNDDHIRVLQCGPAGEKMVHYSIIVNELKHVIGRTGLGAVMGSKKLRAIAVRGRSKPSYADDAKIQEITKKAISELPNYPIAQNYKKYGTAFLVQANHDSGMLPTRNWQVGKFEGAEAISGQTMLNSITVATKGCYACPLRCKRVVEVKGKYEASPEYGGPEYETVGAFGSLCGISNLEAIAHANELCNKWGIDTISTGVSIAFAMELRERNILSKEDVDGIDLKFGNVDAMIQMVHKIAARDGFGNLLSLGVKKASQIIGKGSEKYAMHVKGQELPLHEVRGKHGVALSFALSPTGADHIEAPHDTAFASEGMALNQVKPIGIIRPVAPQDIGYKKISLFVHTEQIFSFFNCLGICNFTGAPYSSMSLQMIADLVAAATGWNTSIFELMELGERAITMARIFNIREGLTSKDDNLPKRFYKVLEKGQQGEKKIVKADFEHAKKLYYEALGWDSTGIPTKGRLAYLDLDWLIEQIDQKK